MDTIKQIERLTHGLPCDEVAYLIKGDRQVSVKWLQAISGAALEELILSYLLDGFTATPF